ncbi:MAG: FAD-dependent oxidoreductase [Planctomycetales bacterium]|nr:FAD-dependent oxidoreductase [Planctomycetales bacterium]
MVRMYYTKLLIWLTVWLLPMGTHATEPVACDVLIYGATPAGIMAAIAASENGQRTYLLAPNQIVGGVMTSGLCATDMNSSSLIGGYARKFFNRVYRHYEIPATWQAETRDEYFSRSVHRVYTGKNDALEMQWVFEPRVAKQIYDQMLAEANVQVITHARLDLTKGVERSGNRIHKIRLESGQAFVAKVYIDATYEGDLMAQSGSEFIVGRESNETYGEKFNGVHGKRMSELYASSSGPVNVDPFVRPGHPSSGLLPFVAPHPPGVQGQADRGVQAYCFRYTLTNNPTNRRSIERPSNFNPLWFEMLGRLCQANPEITLRSLMSMAPLPNQKVDVNVSNMPGVNYGWANGDYTLRSELMQLHKDFALGKLYFLITDPRVPKAVRDELSTYGLPKDEYADNDNFPYELYVREARRMVSEYVMTEHDELRSATRTVADGIAVGSYAVDSHQVGYYVDELGELFVDGSLWQNARRYPISYRSIIPKQSQCVNLVVPVCVSSSHSAYGSIRMEPVFMVMGHSAGTAAALAIQRECSLQELPYTTLRAKLEAEGQIFID